MSYREASAGHAHKWVVTIPQAGSPPRATHEGRRHPGSAWLALIGLSFVAGAGAQEAALPAPFMLAALFVGVAVALSGLVVTSAPRPAYRASQALAGVLMGSYINQSALRGVARMVLPLMSVTGATIVFSIGVALLLSRHSHVNRATATLGMVPGGSPAMLAAADDLGADTRLVALAQYFRVGVIAASAPLIVHVVNPSGSERSPLADHSSPFGPTAMHLVGGADQAGGLAVLGVVMLLGMSVGRLLSLPAPAVLGPMLLTGLVTVTDIAHGFAPAGALQKLVFTCIGLEIGLRFSRASLRRSRRLIVHFMAGTLAVSLGCLLLAIALAHVTDMSFTDAYLATTPGGINAVLATAVASHSNVALISSVQSLRLFGVVVLTPPLIRRVLAHTARPDHHT